ncbi:ABC transporter permease [Elioraea thermophila]|uniref:ABC transporter permease n=1 Tax=Elioraea thermophila TaxID=2185104 RepID=UPI001E5C1014|nr:ABC transporter permease [Elioraea thermophila]
MVGRARVRLEAALLLAPLLLFIALTFAAPIAAMLWRGVSDAEVRQAFPRTLTALADWDGRNLPGDEAFAALAEDLLAARAAGTLNAAAGRLNSDTPGLRTVVFATARRLARGVEGSPRAAILTADPAWGEVETWGAFRRAGATPTDTHLLAALDLRRSADGTIIAVPEEQRLFRAVALRTVWIGLLVTLLCLLLGYPLAAALVFAPRRLFGLLLFAVLLPFWTSLIVRTAAWMVLLAREGVINQAFLAVGLVVEPVQMLFTRTAVLIAMVHILLPFMVLPLYAVMRQIPRAQLRAAASLGAGPVAQVVRVWLPQTLPGVGAGALMVFIQAIGFYVTPALIGGGADQMLPYFIGFYATQTVNWGLAAALSILLLVGTLLILALFGRFLGLAQFRAA